MLAPDHRLRSSAEFTQVVRAGRRASRGTLTVHLLLPGDPGDGTTRAGLVVSRAVGNAVVRHRTARRLRHLLRDRLPGLTEGSRVVVRCAPAAGSASSAALAADLDAAFGSATRPRRPAPVGGRPAGGRPVGGRPAGGRS